MSTYAIGDIQGCYDPLMRLLQQINFNPTEDTLWLTGDLVNRGSHSLQTLRFIKSLGPKAITVLGNHDLTLLAVAHQAFPFDDKHHTFLDILEAPDKEALLSWLIQQPLMHYDQKLGYVMVHAGIYPKWDLKLALSLAHEVETQLQGTEAAKFLAAMYGNKPSNWSAQLQGYDRLRFIVNCFTRMRFCSADGELELTLKEAADQAPLGYMPWFLIPNESLASLKILFGHWASLAGKCTQPNVFALDTGCVWGNCLTALRLEDGQKFSTSC